MNNNNNLDSVLYEQFQNTVDYYNPNTVLKSIFDINIIKPFASQSELSQQKYNATLETQQTTQQSSSFGNVAYFQQQMHAQNEFNEINRLEEQSSFDAQNSNSDNYLIEVNEKKSFFKNIRSGFSNIFKRMNQKSLPNPNESKAKHTNMSLDDYDRKVSFMSAIRSLGDKIANATKAITHLSNSNKQPLNTPANMDYQNNSGQNLDISNNPNSANKKDFIKPKAVESVAKSQPRESQTNFDKFIRLNNSGNQIEKAAMASKKSKSNNIISKNKDVSTNSRDENADQQFVE